MNLVNKLVFVEKKIPYNIQAKALLNDFKSNLNLPNLKNIRIINRYLINNIDEQTFNNALISVFSEPPVDNYYIDKFPVNNNEISFAVSLLPGQFDQRASSTEQCLKLINVNNQSIITTAIVIVLEGKITNQQLKKIKHYYINPIESYEIKPYEINNNDDKIKLSKIQIIGEFINWNISELKQFYSSNSLAMSFDDLLLIQKYFQKEKRNPTITEIKVIDTYWSDHCRHTTFETQIDNISISGGQYSKLIQDELKRYLKTRESLYGKKTKRKISLMDLATIGAKSLIKKGYVKDLDISDENNACSINIDVKINNKIEKYLLMFKNETHNHPTEIEPYGGAATCLGGAIRDPLSGRTWVYQAMRVTGCADPTVPIEQTLPNKLPQRTITLNAAHGYSSYGNQIGLATGQVDEIYHPNYVAKRLEVGAVIAAAPKNNVVRKKPTNGDAIILLGGRTGKDGVGGATGSSKSQTNKSIHTSGAEVQKGNPVEERKIQRLFRNEKVSRLIKKCNDFGAGGVAVAIGELCDGLDINLDLVPKKYQGLNGTELAISESQERMAVVVNKKDAKKFISFANEENLEATIVAKVTNTNHLRMFWNNQKIVNISRTFLNTNGATQHIDVNITSIDKYPYDIKNNIDFNKHWINMIQDLNVCSKIGLIQMFDSSIGANTVLAPLGGKYQLTPSEGMASLIPVENKTSNTVSLMSYGFNPYLGTWSPFHMAYYSVIESITKIVAMGGEWNKIRLSFQEYFQRLDKDKNLWGKPFAALLGALKVQQDFNIPSIGGKDSMSGSFENINVPPTLISFAVTTTAVNNVISPEFKQVNSTIVLISPKVNNDKTIDPISLRTNFDIVYKNIVNKNIISAYSLKQFGIAEGLTKMSFGNKIGVDFNNLKISELFEMNYGSLIVEIPYGININKILNGTNYKVIGKTINEPLIKSKQLKINFRIDELITLSLSKLQNVFTYKTTNVNKNVSIKPYKNKITRYSKKKISHPLVVIPVFLGTNCEYDSERAFKKAGARVKQILIRNLNSKILLKSIKQLANAINKANIIMVPGGFSSGDEPDGSAKFIVNVFKNPLIKDATMNLLNNRDGLMIGICNGFQALIKLGLLPYGKITKTTSNSPTLTFNKIHHHMSCMVNTKVISNKSPWLSNLKINDIRTVPISHGEGQFIANEQTMKQLIRNGQIAFQYVDFNNNPTMNMPYNPNGSIYAVEGITSIDGRILGKMGHSERIGTNIYKNIPGKYDQKLFKSGVKYFTHKK